MKTILILLPFEPSSGAGGRKSEAIGTLIKAHENIGYNVITATSIPDQEHVTELYKFDAPTDRILACLYAKFSNKKLKNAIKRLWFKRVSFFTREYVKSKPIDLVFAYSMTADTNLLAYKIFIDNQIPYVING
ncbi:hypothetical protein AAFX23_01140, partial [Vibrio alginolyticus]|uniref:hypothetical protein n=1 Tax=Vibrio alginolyticus TaxID=663 RepID=UPI0038CDB4EE